VGAASSEYGEGDIDVEIGAEPGERRRWATIINHGRGLEEGDRAWLFGRFERDVAGRTSGNGSGPGLYVSRALVRGMGGDLAVDPADPGRGATFRLTPPGEPADEA
jgi:two-component system C4-dicarboxylate transport sensor histidine kinase DctB